MNAVKALGAFALCAGFLWGEVVEEVFFVVNDELITKMDYEEEAGMLELAFQGREKDKPDNFQEVIVSNMIVNILIRQEAVEKGVSITDLDVSNQIKNIVHMNNLGSVDNLKEILPSQGMTWEYFYNQQKNQLIIEHLQGRLFTLKEPEEVRVREFYEENKEELFQLEEPLYKLSVIFIKKEKGMTFSELAALDEKANAVLKELKSGKPFAETAKTYSEDISSKATGGGVGWKFRSEYQREPQVAKEVFRMKKGELSKVVPGENGFYIFKVEDVQTKGYIPYEKATFLVKRKMMFDQRAEKMNELLEKIKNDAVVIQRTDFFGNYKFK